jgi:fibronectin-binding autotransporter adhesin
MSITRIQNNQITDSTIVAYAKVQSGSLTGNLFAPTITLNSNVTINGNLFLANTGNTTTINATNTYVNDPIVVFNNGYTGSMTGYDVGILVNRNLSPLGDYGSVNTAWVWVEDDQAWEAFATTDTGSGSTSINNSGFANIKVGNSTILGSQVITGAATAGSLTVSGASSLKTVVASSFQGIIGNVTPAAAFFTGVNAASISAITVGNIGANVVGTGTYLTSLNASNLSSGTVPAAQLSGAYTGITVVGELTNLDVNGISRVLNTTDNNSLSYTNGSFQVYGGAGIAGNLYVGGNATVVGNINLTGNVNSIVVTGNSGQFFGNAAGFGALYTGISSGFVFQPQTVLQNSTNFNGYAQVNHQNINSGTDATTDFVVTADNGTENTYYLDMGITSSGYDPLTPTNSLGTSVFPNDSYLYSQGKAGFGGGNLILGTSIPGTVTRIIAGGVDAANVVATISNTKVAINSTTQSTNTTSGALTVAGGAGISGNLNVGGTFSAGAASFLSINNTPIGNTTPSTGAFTTLTASGVTQVTNATAATNTTSGALQVTGGVGVQGSVYAATINDNGNRVVTALTSTGSGNLTVGGTAPSLTIALPNSGPGATTWGGSTQIPSITFDAFGRASAAANTALNTVAVTNLGNTTEITANSSVGLVGLSLTTTGVSAGNYGSATVVPTIQVDSKGRVVSLTSNSVSASYNLYGTSGVAVVTSTGTGGGSFDILGSFGVTTTASGSTLTIATPQDLQITANPTFNNATLASLQAVAIGNVTPGTGAFTSLTTQTETVGGLQAKAIGNVTPGTAAFTTSTTGGLQAGAIGNVTPGTGAFTSLSSGTTAQFNTVTAASFQGIIGNITPADGTFTTLSTGGLQAVAIGNVTPGTGAFTTSTTGGLQAVAIGNVTPGTGAFTTGTFNTLSTGGLQAVAIGNVTPGTAVFTTINASGASTLNTITGASFQGVIGNVSPNTGAFTTVTAATINAATIGNSGAVLTGTLSTAAQPNVTSVGALTGLTVSGSSSLNTITGASFQGVIGNVSPNTGAFTTLSASGITQVLSAAENNSTTYSSGALQVTGGAGIGGNLYVGGNLVVMGNVYEVSTEIISGSEVVAGTITANSGTASTSTTTGALIVNGGAGVSGAVYAASFQGVIGNVTPAAGTFTSLSATSISVPSINNTVIGNVTPSSGAFTTLTATSLNAATIGNSGAVLYGTLNSSSASQTNITSVGTLTGLTVSGTTNLQATTATTIQAATIGNSGATLTGTLSTAAQTNITSVGTLTGLTVSGSTNLQTTTATTIQAATIGNSGAVLTGTLSTAAQTNITSVGNLTTLSVAGTTTNWGNLVAAATTPSTSTTTGALVVPNGGIGATGNINVGNSASSIHQLLGNVVIGVGNGAAGATAPLTVNKTSAAPLTTASVIHAIGEANTSAKVTVDSISNDLNTMSIFVARTAAGTPSAPTAVQNGANLGGFIARGYGPSGYFIADANNSAGITYYADETFTDSAHGTGAVISVIPKGSLNAIPALLINSNGQVITGPTINSTDQFSGGFVTAGGAGIGGNLNVGGNAAVTGYLRGLSNGEILGNLLVLGNKRTTNSTTGALVVTGGIGVSGNINIGTQLFVGQNSQDTPLISPTVVLAGTSADGGGVQYAQAAMFNATSDGSTDWIAYGNNYPGPSSDHGWMDMGFTGDSYNDPFYTITKPNDGYLFASAANVSYGGNLVLSTDYTGSHNDIVIGVGSFLAESEVARFHGNISSSGNLRLKYTTAATSTTTGALQISGGVGIAGAVYAGSIQSTPIGSTSASTGAFTTVSTGGLQAVAIGNVTPGTGAFTTLVATNFSTGNAQITGGNLSGVTNFNATTASVDNFASGNAQITGGKITGLSGGTGSTSAATTQTLRVTSGGIGITGDSYFVNSLGIGTNFTVTGTTGLTGALTFTTATGGGLQAVAIGNVTPGTAQFTTLGASGATTLNTVTAASFQGIIGNVTPNTATFTTASTGGLQAVAIGNVTPGTGAFTTGSFNTVTTGGLQAVAIGNVTPGTAAFTTLSTSGVTTHSGNVVINSGVDTTSTSTGALMVTGSGGAMIGGNAYVGNNLYIGPNSLTQTFAAPTIVAVDNGTNYAQIALKNTNANGSADYAAYADNGSDAGGWVDMGVAGSTFSDGNYTITKPNDGYLITRPVNSTYGGNLVIGTSEAGFQNDITISVGSFFANAEVARFHGNTSNNGSFVLKLPTANNNTANTGALQVWGGASISGNAYTGGAAIFNGSQTSNYDFKVRGVNTTNLLWARPNSTYDTVIVGDTLSPAAITNGAKLIVNSTDAMIIPTGTSPQRPDVAGYTAVAGMLRFNTTIGAIEFFSGTQWVSPGTAFTVIADAQFSGTGSQVNFTLPSAQTTNSCFVSINGIIQIPTLSYSVTGTTMTFTEAPASGDVIDVRLLTTTTTVTSMVETTGNIGVNVITGNGVQFVSGTDAPTIQYVVNTSGAMVTCSPNVIVATSNTPTTVDSFYSNTYSSAKYLVTSTIQGTGIREVAEILVVSNDTDAYVTSYGFVRTAGNSLTTFTATLTGGSVNLQATTTNNNTILRIKRDYQSV